MSVRSMLLPAIVVFLSSCATGSSLGGRGGSAPVVLSYERPPAAQPYGGKESCRSCHGVMYNLWAASRHARSFEDLGGEAKRPSCLRCHATGYGEQTGFVDGETTPALAAVTCEACHGAAGDHAGSRHPGLVPTANGRDCSSCEVSRICRACHTPLHSPDFRLDRALPSLSCRKAEQVEGKDNLLSRRKE